jgi:hypothetical protein
MAGMIDLMMRMMKIGSHAKRSTKRKRTAVTKIRTGIAAEAEHQRMLNDFSEVRKMFLLSFREVFLIAWSICLRYQKYCILLDKLCLADTHFFNVKNAEKQLES